MSSDNNTKYSRQLVDARSAAFARLASRVLETLDSAVEKRRDEGVTLSAIAERIGCHKSAVSRVLNGNVRNLTLRTISDILWAADHEPKDFQADPIEDICPNWTGDVIIHFAPPVEQRVLPVFSVHTEAQRESWKSSRKTTFDHEYRVAAE